MSRKVKTGKLTKIQKKRLKKQKKKIIKEQNRLRQQKFRDNQKSIKNHNANTITMLLTKITEKDKQIQELENSIKLKDAVIYKYEKILHINSNNNNMIDDDGDDPF